jgi:NAD(P)-dependent dehydrogenase (short-subunit alcohol dehydrogenase family)
MRVALVTGGNRGIGFEVARQLGEKGNRIILGSRDPNRGELAAGKLASMKIEVAPAQLDVTNQGQVDELARRIQSEFGRLDILVNNAGIMIDHEKASATDLDLLRSTLETNLIGPWRLCKAFIPLMKRNHYGRIVNVSSGAGSFPGGTTRPSGYGPPAYSLSKTSLNALTLMLASELRGTNILVNAACPGHTRTDMGGPNAPRSVQEGADTVVWLATLPDDGPTGGVFLDRKRIDW